MTHSEMNKLIRQLRHDGFTTTLRGGGHWRITRPDMAMPVFAAASPSDRRALRKLRATIRRSLTQPQETD